MFPSSSESVKPSMALHLFMSTAPEKLFALSSAATAALCGFSILQHKPACCTSHSDERLQHANRALPDAETHGKMPLWFAAAIISAQKNECTEQ